MHKEERRIGIIAFTGMLRGFEPSRNLAQQLVVVLHVLKHLEDKAGTI